MHAWVSEALGPSVELNPYSMQYGRELSTKAADSCSDNVSSATASSELAALESKYRSLQEVVKSQNLEITALQEKLDISDARIKTLQEEKATMMDDKAAYFGPPHDDGEASMKHEEPPVISWEASKQRLRRLCQKKADGTCQVPKEIHEQWAQGGQSREGLLKIFVENGMDKNAFLRQVSLESKKSREMKVQVTGDFYTEDEMRDVLKLPKHLF